MIYVLIVSWNKLKSLFVHLRQTITIIICSLDFYFIKSQWFITSLSKSGMSSLLETYNSQWTNSSTCNWSLSTVNIPHDFLWRTFSFHLVFPLFLSISHRTKKNWSVFLRTEAIGKIHMANDLKTLNFQIYFILN